MVSTSGPLTPHERRVPGRSVQTRQDASRQAGPQYQKDQSVSFKLFNKFLFNAVTFYIPPMGTLLFPDLKNLCFSWQKAFIFIEKYYFIKMLKIPF